VGGRRTGFQVVALGNVLGHGEDAGGEGEEGGEGGELHGEFGDGIDLVFVSEEAG
jgi:hypothetical protein